MVCKTGEKPRVISILTPSLAMTPVYTLLPAWACFKFRRTLFRKSWDDFRRISEFFKAFRMGLISLSLLKPFRKDVLTYSWRKSDFFHFPDFFSSTTLRTSILPILAPLSPPRWHPIARSTLLPTPMFLVTAKKGAL